MTAPVTFGSIALAPVMAEFVRRHPEAEIALDLTDRYVDIVGEGFDIAIRLGPLADTGLKVRALKPYRLIACASPAYLAARGMPRTPEDLARHDCLGFLSSSGQAQSEWRFARDGVPVVVSVHSRLYINDARALREMALRGDGIILQADLILADDLATGRLLPVLPGYDAPMRPLHALYPANRPPTRLLRHVLDEIARRFAPR